MGKKLLMREGLRKQKRGQLGGNGLRSEKYPANTRCPRCDLHFEDGVWKHADSNRRTEWRYKLCPACTQIRNGITGGIVHFSGAFADIHRQELLNRIRNVVKETQEDRPLERIIEVKEDKDGILVSATTEHLAVKIGKHIQRDFGGTLHLKYAPEDKFAFVQWHRDA